MIDEENNVIKKLDGFLHLLLFPILIIMLLTYIFTNSNVKKYIFGEKEESQAYNYEINISPYTVSDLTGTKWELNSSIIYDSAFTYYINFNAYCEDNSVAHLSTLFSDIQSVELGRPPYPTFYMLRYQSTEDINFSNLIFSDVLYTGINTTTMENTADDSSFNSHLFNGIIEITGGTDSINSDLISWLESNATLQQSGPTQLTTPTITKSSYNQISWSSVSNADSYEIYKNGQLYDTIINTLYNVDSLGDYQVIAVGDGVIYTNSELSNTITISSTQLNTPILILNDNLITWSNIQNAVSYNVYLYNVLIDNVNTTSYEFEFNGDYQVQAVSNSLFFTNSNLSSILTINYQYADVVFYAKDNITELLHIENWLVGKSIYNFTNANYNYNSLITLLLIDSGYSQNDITYGYIDFIFNDNQLFENSYFANNFIISSDINIYYKTTIPLYPRYFYNSNDYSLTSSNSIDLFTNLGDNLISEISLNTINVKYTYLISNQTSIITTDTLLNDFVVGDNFSIFVDSYGNNFYFDCLVTQNGSNYIYTNYLYRADINSNTYIIPVMDYNKFVLYNDLTNKYEFIQNLSNVSITIYNTNFVTSFSYNQGINFYYCNYIGFTFNIENYNTNNVTNNFKCYIQDTNNMFYQINYNYGSTNLINDFNYILLNSNYFNSYIYKNTYLYLNFQSLLTVNGLSNTYDNKADCITALENLSIKFSFGNPILYYYDTTDKTNSSTGTGLIPTSSDGLYKTDFAWYDVTAYIYNFFIYLIFDMPIVSNITKLVYQIIQLILFVINQIILLFSGVINNIFLVSILGFLLLKFTIDLLVKH